MSTVKLKKENPHKAEMKEMRRKSSKPLLWIGIVSIIMLFAGLTSAYVVRADNGNWLVFQLPPIAIVSTAVIITSSLSMFIAQLSIKKKQTRHGQCVFVYNFRFRTGFYLHTVRGMEGIDG